MHIMQVQRQEVQTYAYTDTDANVRRYEDERCKDVLRLGQIVQSQTSTGSHVQLNIVKFLQNFYWR